MRTGLLLIKGTGVPDEEKHQERKRFSGDLGTNLLRKI